MRSPSTRQLAFLVIGFVAGGLLIGYLTSSDDDPAPPEESAATRPPPFDFDSADALIGHACGEVRDVNARAIEAASEAYDRGVAISQPSRSDMVADAEVIRLRRAALAAELAALEVPSHRGVARAITLLAVTAGIFPDELIIEELLYAEDISPAQTAIGLNQAFDRALSACQGIS